MPDERPTRRIPIQSVRDGNDDIGTTQKLRLLVYLREVERQAEIYNACLPKVVAAAVRPDGANDAFRHIQSAMFAAIVVNRLVSYNGNPRHQGWPGEIVGARQAARDAVQWRVSELRRLLKLGDANEDDILLYKVRKVRDSLEHVDERIDRALHSRGVASLADWYITDGGFVVSRESAEEGVSVAGLRAFHPESGFFLFDREALNLYGLDLEMLKLRHNSRTSQSEIVSSLRGGMMFGGSQVIQMPASHINKITVWLANRKELEEGMPPSV